MDFSNRWVAHLRNASRQDQVPETGARPLSCVLCSSKVKNDAEDFRKHLQEDPDAHAEWDTEEAILQAFAEAQAAARADATARPPPTNQPTTRKRRSPDQDDRHSTPGDEAMGSGPDEEEKIDRSPKRTKSPPAFANSPSHASTPRSRARNDETRRGNQNTSRRQLWQEGQEGEKAPPGRAVHIHPPNMAKPPPSQSKPAPSQPPITQSGTGASSSSESGMMLQPETRPISQDQLVAEVKGIYAGLVMVETKCIEVDNAQSANKDANSKLNNEQWQALIALHRTLLHEHHDFFLASQHPSASAPLRRLASKYAMPARMWRHGIHSFLELLRRKLPGSLEHMLTFLYLAYSMMALLYETVPAFEDTWIECLGDLGRYRMAIEDDDIRDREVWTGVSRHWYSKASDKSPTTGRLYHHLAILARPNALQQLFFYAKSLCVPVPFPSARESVMTLFDPLLTSNTTRLPAIEAAFVRVNGILFSGKCKDQLNQFMEEFLSLLDNHIGRTTKRWLEAGYFIGISLGCSLLGYGSDANVLMRALAQKSDDTDVTMEGNTITEPPADDTFLKSLQFTIRTVKIVINRWGDTNTLAFIHSIILFLTHLAQYPTAMAYLEAEYPWKLTAELLNQLYTSCEPLPKISSEFPRPEKEDLPRPFPEDYAMRGLLYAADYFPTDWFINNRLDDDEKSFELPSMTAERKVRILSLGHKLAASGKWITYDETTQVFGVAAKFDVELEDVPLPTIET